MSFLSSFIIPIYERLLPYHVFKILLKRICLCLMNSSVFLLNEKGPEGPFNFSLIHFIELLFSS